MRFCSVRPTVEAQKGGVAHSRLDERSLSEKSVFFNLDRVLLGFLSFKRVLLLNSPLSRAPLRQHY